MSRLAKTCGISGFALDKLSNTNLTVLRVSRLKRK